MVRRLSLLMGFFAALFFVSFPVHAQEGSDKVEIFGGYSYLRFNPNGLNSRNLNGWEASGQYKFADWIGGVADFSGDYGTVGGVGSSSVTTFVFGPQVSFPARVSPFAHVLVGGAHFSFGHGGSSDTGFASAVGAGFDAKVRRGISWRIIQGDWLHTSFFGNGQNNARISTGLVFRF